MPQTQDKGTYGHIPRATVPLVSPSPLWTHRHIPHMPPSLMALGHGPMGGAEPQTQDEGTHRHNPRMAPSPMCHRPLWHWDEALQGSLWPYKGHFGPTRVTVLWAQDKGTPCATTLPTCVPGMRPSGPFPQRRHRKRSFPFCCPRGCSFSHPKWGHTPSPPPPSPYRSLTLLLSRPLCALPPKQRQGLSPIPHNTVNPNGTVSPQ